VHLPSLGGGVGAQGLAIPIKAFTRASEVLSQICDILRVTVKDLEGFFLFAPIPDVYPQYTAWKSLKMTELITDSWRSTEKKFPPHNAHLVDKQQPALHLRRKIVISEWPNMEIPQHPVLAQLELEQAAHDVFTGKFPCNVDQATRFAALYLQATTGDISTKNYVNEKNVGQYIAQESAGGKQLAKDINLIHASLSGKNALQMCYEFLINVRSWLFYGSTLFLVEACYDKQNQKYTPMWLSVNQRGLNILSYPGLQPVKFWAIQTISNWNCDGKIFNFVAGNLLKPVREQFVTPEANEIADLMQEYMKFLAGREPVNKTPMRHDSISDPSAYPPALPTIADILPILDGNAHNDDGSKLQDPLPIRDKVAQAKGNVRASVAPSNLRLVVATPRYDVRYSRILPPTPTSPSSSSSLSHPSPSASPSSSLSKSSSSSSSSLSRSSPSSTSPSSLSKSTSPPTTSLSKSTSPSSPTPASLSKSSGKSFGPIKTFGSLSKGTLSKGDDSKKGNFVNSKNGTMKKQASSPVISTANVGHDTDELDLKSISKAYSVFNESYE
jgi:hypothetical protein